MPKIGRGMGGNGARTLVGEGDAQLGHGAQGQEHDGQEGDAKNRQGDGRERRAHGLLEKVMPSSGMAPMDRNMMDRKEMPKKARASVGVSCSPLKSDPMIRLTIATCIAHHSTAAEQREQL